MRRSNALLRQARYACGEPFWKARQRAVSTCQNARGTYAVRWRATEAWRRVIRERERWCRISEARFASDVVHRREIQPQTCHQPAQIRQGAANACEVPPAIETGNPALLVQPHVVGVAEAYREASSPRRARISRRLRRTTRRSALRLPRARVRRRATAMNSECMRWLLRVPEA